MPPRARTSVAILSLAILAAALAARGEAPASGGGTREDAPPAPPASPDPLRRLVDGLKASEALAVGDLWPRIEALGKEAAADVSDPIAALPSRLGELGDKARLAAAVMLLARREPHLHSRGQVVLHELAREAKEKSARIASMRLLGRYTFSDAAYLVLRDVLEAADDAEIKVEASLALWELDNDPALRLPLLGLLEDPAGGTRARAAIALAEMGYFQPPVKGILWELRREPTDRGKLAGLLYERLAAREAGGAAAAAASEPDRAPGEVEARLRQLQRENLELRERMEAGTPGGAGWPAVMDEVLRQIRRYSLHGRGSQPRDLYIAALKGLVSSLDSYSGFLDPEDVERLEAHQLGVTWGIGAHIVKPAKDAPLAVAKPYHGGPAFQAGLRTGDQILEVNGVTTADHDLVEVRGLAAGKEGEVVHLLVRRWGWLEPRLISIARASFAGPGLQAQLFPRNIGYVKVPRIGAAAAADCERSLARLEGEGLQALILDLRDDPGGELEEAGRLVDLFVGESPHPIYSLRDADGKPSERFASAPRRPGYPLFVLVNRFTASSAEVIAGALQDFRRGKVIGERTYGKGVEQTIVPLSGPANELLGGTCQLLLTRRRIYLPLGRPIQPERRAGGGEPALRRGGIEPDIEVEGELDRFAGPELAELERVTYSSQVNAYIGANYRQIKDLYDEGDLWAPEHDSGFEELYRSLGTTLDRESVRYTLRSLLRRHLEDDRGVEFASDYRHDRQLQRAILEALIALGLKPREVAEYASIAGRHFGEEESEAK